MLICNSTSSRLKRRIARSPEGHWYSSIAAVMGDFMGNDQMVLCVDRCLCVVAHHGCTPGAVGGHGPRIGVCLGDLLIVQGLPLRLDDLKLLQALAHLLDLALQSLGLGMDLNWLG
jgi:hypothetical protein